MVDFGILMLSHLVLLRQHSGKNCEQGWEWEWWPVISGCDGWWHFVAEVFLPSNRKEQWRASESTRPIIVHIVQENLFSFDCVSSRNWGQLSRGCWKPGEGRVRNREWPASPNVWYVLKCYAEFAIVGTHDNLYDFKMFTTVMNSEPHMTAKCREIVKQNELMGIACTA